MVQLKVKESEQNSGQNALDTAMADKRALAEELRDMREHMRKVDSMQQEVSVLQAAMVAAEERAMQTLGALANDVGGEIARLQSQLALAENKMEELQERLQASESACARAERDAEEARARTLEAQKAAEAQILALQQEAEAQLRAAKEDAERQRQEAEARMLALKQETEAQLQAAKEDAERQKKEAEARIAALEQDVDAVRRDADNARRETEEQMLLAKQEAQALIDAARQDAEARILAAREEAEALVASAKQEAEDRINALQQDMDAAMKEADERLASAKEEAEARLTALQQETDARIQALNADADRAREEAEARMSAVQLEAQERLAAVERDAEAAKQAAEAQIRTLKEDADAQAQAAKEKEASLNDALTGLRNQCSELEMLKDSPVSSAVIADRVSKTETTLKKMFPHRGALDVLDGSLEGRLLAFYKKHNPNNLGRAWILGDQYAGNEDILNSMLRQTYDTDLEGMNRQTGGILADLVNGLMEEERSEADRMLSHVKSIAQQLTSGGSLDAHTLSVQLLHGKQQRPGALLEAGVVAASMLLMGGSAGDASRVGKGDLEYWHDKVSKALRRMRGDDDADKQHSLGGDADASNTPTTDGVAPQDKPSVHVGNGDGAYSDSDGGAAVWRRLCDLMDECLERIAAQRSELRMDVELETKNQAQLTTLRRKITVLEAELNTMKSRAEAYRNSQGSLSLSEDEFRYVCIVCDMRTHMHTYTSLSLREEFK